MASNQIVKNDSKAYGYNYASLADIAKQGFEIPKMTTRMIEGQIFVFWYDKEAKDWLQGAPLVIPEMKGMNKAQAMGSALTYARRYTAQMALGLACDDDARLERQAGGHEQNRQAGVRQLDFDEVRKKITTLTSDQELVQYWNSLKMTSGQVKILQPSFTKRREELKRKEDKDGLE